MILRDILVFILLLVQDTLARGRYTLEGFNPHDLTFSSPSSDSEYHRGGATGKKPSIGRYLRGSHPPPELIGPPESARETRNYAAVVPASEYHRNINGRIRYTHGANVLPHVGDHHHHHHPTGHTKLVYVPRVNRYPSRAPHRVVPVRPVYYLVAKDQQISTENGGDGADQHIQTADNVWLYGGREAIKQSKPTYPKKFSPTLLKKNKVKAVPDEYSREETEDHGDSALRGSSYQEATDDSGAAFQQSEAMGGRGGDRVEFQMYGMNGPNSYKFGYDTGKGDNRHFRFEERDNSGKIRGHYGYLDNEGKMRIMKYEADPETGFHAGPVDIPEEDDNEEE